MLMTRQLVLIDESPRDWRMDERTREIGRRGVAAARAALAAHARPDAPDSDTDSDGGSATDAPRPHLAA